MPVVFAQPEPMAPDIQEQGGRADVMTKDFPTIAGMYEAANRNALAASTATAQNATHASIAQAQIAAQGGEAAEQLRQRQHEFAASQRPSERDQYLASVQAASSQQHAQLQSWLQGQELSQAESMRLQRMQNALGDIQADPNLDDESKTNLMTQLKTGIDPLRQRVENSKAKMQEQQAQQVLHANAQQTSMENMDAASRSAEFQKRVVSLPDPQTGEMRPFYTDHKGDLKAIPFDEGKAKPAAAEKPEKPWDAVHEQKQAEAEAEMLVKKANPGFEMKDPEADKDLKKNAHTLATQIYHERRQDYQDRQNRPAGGAGTTQNPPPGQPGAGGQADQTPAPAPAVPHQPWTWDPHNREKTSEADLKPQQQKVVAGYKTALAVINNGPLTDDQRKDAKDALDERLKLVQEKGPPEFMKPADQAKYRELDKRIVANFPAKAAPPPPPAPPGPLENSWLGRGHDGGKSMLGELLERKRETGSIWPE
jgi:hypothetical protein